MNASLDSAVPVKARLDGLQYCRAFAALSVVLFHAGETMAAYTGGRALDVDIIKAGQLGVELFFVLSGFIILRAHASDIGVSARWKTYAQRRLTRIYPLFWIALAGSVALSILLSDVDPRLMVPVSALGTVLLYPFETMPPHTVAWTLSYELLFYMLFGLMILKASLGKILIALWVIGSLLSLVVELPYGLSRFVFSHYTLLFGMGMVSEIASRHLSPRLELPMFLAGAGVLSGAALLFTSLPKVEVSLLAGLGSAILVCGLSLRQSTGRSNPLSSVFVFLGDASFSIYLIHTVAMTFLARVLLKFGVITSDTVIVAALFTIGVAVGIAFHLAFEKPLLRAMRRAPDRPLKPA